MEKARVIPNPCCYVAETGNVSVAQNRKNGPVRSIDTQGSFALRACRGRRGHSLIRPRDCHNRRRCSFGLGIRFSMPMLPGDLIWPEMEAVGNVPVVQEPMRAPDLKIPPVALVIITATKAAPRAAREEGKRLKRKSDGAGTSGRGRAHRHHTAGPRTHLLFDLQHAVQKRVVRVGAFHH